MLTDAAVRKLRPHKKRREVPDAHALRLIIQPSGHKSWALRFRRNGKPAKLTLGTCDLSGKELEGEPVIGGHLTLTAARRLTAEIHRQRALGKDVIAERKAEKHRRALQAADVERTSFPSAARLYTEREARGRKQNRNWRKAARVLGLAYPAEGGEPTLTPGALAERWADRAVTSITADDVFVLIDEAREQGIPGRVVHTRGPSEARAREMAGTLSALFSWLKAKRRVAMNPCAGMERPGPSRKRERVLNSKVDVRGADEVRWLWAAVDSVGEPFGSLVKILLLTGQRRTEVAEMQRRELSDDLAVWTIPSSRTKNKREHVVPIAPLAQELLREILKDSRSNFVFTTTGRSPVSGFGKLKKRLDRAMLAGARDEDPAAVIPPWTLHDLRRTCVTGMVEIGVEPHVVEAVVNHVSGHKSGVAGVYNVATYAEPKRKALERWAIHVETIASGEVSEKIVQMRRRKEA